MEESWYIIKQASEQCEIVSQQELDALEGELLEQWGPFESKGRRSPSESV